MYIQPKFYICNTGNYIYTCHTRACTYICIQTRHTHHIIACIHAQCFIHIHHVTINCILVTAPWDYALHMAYDNGACCFAHHTHHYHGWHSNSSRFLDLSVRMMKTSTTCLLPSMNESIRAATSVIRAWHKHPHSQSPQRS